jgi:hypothetical protein
MCKCVKHDCTEKDSFNVLQSKLMWVRMGKRCSFRNEDESIVHLFFECYLAEYI